ncbi:MAG: hypothetical protein V9G08_00085 [Dermatophilaceae bacterium]
MDQTQLADRISRLHETLSPAEQANLKLLLGLSAGQLASDADNGQARAEVTRTLDLLCPYDVADPHGLQYRGRPPFLTDQLLAQLQQDAHDIAPRAVPFDEHYLGYGSAAADALSTSDELRGFIAGIVPSAVPTGVASLLYYRDPGQGIRPHVDTDIFSLNVLIMLEHGYPDDLQHPSALQMHYADGTVEPVVLEPGELVVFLAGTQAHSRSPIVRGEHVTILTLGFMPEGAPIENYRR